jgi:hypothetical protein
MKTFLLLQDGTVGALYDGRAEVGEVVTVVLHTENGVEILVDGIVEEVL